MRKAIYTLAALIGVLIAAILLGVLVLATESGSRWLIDRGINHVPGQLTVRRLEGSVLTGLRLYGVEHRQDQFHSSIERVELDWQPMALLDGTVRVRSLYIDGITCALLVVPESSAEDSIQLAQDISFPFAVVVEDARLKRVVFRRGDTHHALDQVRLAGIADRSGLQLKQFEAEGGSIHINIQGHAKLSQPHSFKGSLNWSKQLPNGLTAKGICDLNGDLTSIRLNHKLKEPFFLETRGRLELKRIFPQTDFTGQHREMRQRLTGEALYPSGNGQQSVRSKADSYHIIFSGDLTAQDLPPGQIQVSGRGNPNSFQVDELSGHTLGGLVKINGHIDWRPELGWQFAVSAEDINPGLQWPGWPGKLALEAEVEGGIEAGTPIILLRDLKLVGHLLEKPFQLTGNLKLRDKKLTLGDVEIRSGQNQLNVDGTASPDLGLTFTMDAEDPASLWPGVRGHLRGKGSLQGTPNSPIGSISLEGSKINYGNYALGHLDAYLFLNSKDIESSNAWVKLQNLVAGDEIFSSISLKWLGDFKSHRVGAGFVAPSARADLEFKGSCYQDTWKLEVKTASFNVEQYGMWRLKSPVNLLVENTKIEPFKACWSHEQSNTCMQGSWKDSSGWQIEGDVGSPPLDYMIDLLRELFKEEHLVWGKDAHY